MNEPRLIFAVDGGASKTEAVLRRPDGTVLARHRAGPCNLYQDPLGGVAAIRACWQACIAAHPATTAETCLSAGLAGLSGPGAAEAFHQAFADFPERLLSGDGYAALVGAFGAGPGALLSIGTGTVGCRFDASGRFVQLGGWGFVAGDRGGGAWLGRELVAEWLEHRDGAGLGSGSEALWQAVAAQVGRERGQVLLWLREAKPGRFAQLVPALLQAAQARDDVALRLLHAAGAHVARLASALVSPEALPLVLSGGLASSLTPYLPAGLGDWGIVASALEGAFRIALGVRPPEYMRLDASGP